MSIKGSPPGHLSTPTRNQISYQRQRGGERFRRKLRIHFFERLGS